MKPEASPATTPRRSRNAALFERYSVFEAGQGVWGCDIKYRARADRLPGLCARVPLIWSNFLRRS